MAETTESKPSMEEELRKYCERFDVPMEYIMDIISDQKVLPMIRGKGVEYNLFRLLNKNLNKTEWAVEKRDLNPQPNQKDEDIVVIHKKSGKEIIVECKSAVRGSFRMKTNRHQQPHFHVKCHRSRSFMGKKTNDRYFSSDFDIVISNPSNALIKAGPKFELITNEAAIGYLKGYYNVRTPEEIFKVACKDWRFAISKEIANREGVIDRTPLVLFDGDEHWQDISQIVRALFELIQ